MIKDQNAIHLYGWMKNRFGLKGVHLLLFALIFSFTNGTDDHCFHGSAKYAAEWCGVSKRTILDKFKELEEMGLIFRKERFENGVKFVDYYAIDCDGDEETSSGEMKNFHQGGDEKTSPHNKELLEDKEDNKEKTREEKFSIKNFDEGGIEHPQAPVEGLGFYDFDDPYVQSMMKNKSFWNNNLKSLQKLMKKGYTIDTIRTVCAFIRQDNFWCKNIRSLSKLLDKNKDGVMYIDVMIDKIKQRKPKVIDLDSLY